MVSLHGGPIPVEIFEETIGCFEIVAVLCASRRELLLYYRGGSQLTVILPKKYISNTPIGDTPIREIASIISLLQLAS